MERGKLANWNEREKLANRNEQGKLANWNEPEISNMDCSEVKN